MKLSERRRSFSIVINPPKDTAQPMEWLNLYVTSIKTQLNAYSYFAIIHDKDKNEAGENKTKHLHLILLSSEKSSGLDILTMLCKLLNCKEVQISIDKVYNIRQDIRYLIHKDQPQKYQYSKNEIITNRKTYLWTCLEDEQEYQTFTIKDCEKAVMVEHLDLIDLMKRYGLEQYKKNRVVMIDIINAFLRDETK